MGGAVGALGAAAMGKDPREGGAIGAFAGLGIAGAGRAISKSLGSVEDNFIRSLLGSSTTEVGTTTLRGVANRKGSGAVNGLTVRNMIDEGLGDLSYKQILGLEDDAIKTLYSTQKSAGSLAGGINEDAFAANMNRPIRDADQSFLNRTVQEEMEGFAGSYKMDENLVTKKVTGIDYENTSRADKLTMVSNLSEKQLKEAEESLKKEIK